LVVTASVVATLWLPSRAAAQDPCFEDLRRRVWVGDCNTGFNNALVEDPELLAQYGLDCIVSINDLVASTADDELEALFADLQEVGLLANANVLVGSDGRDYLRGTHGRDLVLGLGGRDLIVTLGGGDGVCGGDGPDVILAGSGTDRVNGQAGPDLIRGGPDNDILFGGDGNDIVLGGPGWDQIDGDHGHDQLLGEGDPDSLSGGDGHDDLFGGGGDDILGGGEDDDDLLGGVGFDGCLAGSGQDDERGCETAILALGAPCDVSQSPAFVAPGPGEDGFWSTVRLTEEPLAEDFTVYSLRYFVVIEDDPALFPPYFPPVFQLAFFEHKVELWAGSDPTPPLSPRDEALFSHTVASVPDPTPGGTVVRFGEEYIVPGYSQVVIDVDPPVTVPAGQHLFMGVQVHINIDDCSQAGLACAALGVSACDYQTDVDDRAYWSNATLAEGDPASWATLNSYNLTRPLVMEVEGISGGGPDDDGS
jgi:hypothetical protein